MSSPNSYMAHAMNIHIMTLQQRELCTVGRFWKKPCLFPQSIPNQLTARIQTPFNTPVSIVVYMISLSIIYILTVGKICLELNKTGPPIVWVL